MKTRTIYIGLLLIFIIGLLSIIGTFAIDTTITEGNSSTADYLFNITLGNRTDRQIIIPSYDSKIVDIKISNPNAFDISYLLYLEGINSNISIINIGDTDASGVLNSKSTNIIKVFIQNNSSGDITVNIKDMIGFETEELSLPSNSTAINKNKYYKVIVKSNNYGKVKPNIKLSAKNGILKYALSPNTGYEYVSNTCGGTVENNVLTISNITSDITCNVTFKLLNLYNYIKSNADTTTQIDFSKTSEASNTNGIYVTTNTGSGDSVYYYRGNVDNHLIFANFCWRIVRTTETGGVKLIYDGVPSNGQCNNTGDATIIGNYQFNSKYVSPAYGGYMYGAAYTTVRKTMSLLSGSIVFGNDITYANGVYTLKDTYTLTDASNWSTEYTTIASKYHYTCFNSSDTCEKVDYIHYTSDLYSTYFEFSNGEDHINTLKEMLDNSTNENDSTIKTAVDTWYKNNMTNYTSQLEDIVFCNDRSYDASKTGWNKDYSNAGSYLYFDSYQRIGYSQPSLVCTNTNDEFTVDANNGNGMLTYPVGLLTADEIVYAGGKKWAANSSSFYLNNNQDVWALTPDYSGSAYIYEYILTSSGYLHVGSVNSSHGVRPVISLKPGTTLSSGLGTATEPLIVN